ncbi:long-chain fatty acid--CoA ligase [Pseudonocardia sp. K10HN5]|uniref:Long-chain fatty acid--CoA ligase n=1 Tax=Pseudonocardia acidicola TaxID=2724939 RepID=A0ABX1S9C8_9PSEU|nr:hypothetical protein [Pseudonocardia acidicola]NMH98170.1 long-chain fatty acid--CoA ligase [Pseudonocardia acidicola]
MFERAPGDVAEISRAEMDARASRTAGALVGRGIGPGDRFNVHLTNRPAFYDLWFAAATIVGVDEPWGRPDDHAGATPVSPTDTLGCGSSTSAGATWPPASPLSCWWAASRGGP